MLESSQVTGSFLIKKRVIDLRIRLAQSWVFNRFKSAINLWEEFRLIISLLAVKIQRLITVGVNRLEGGALVVKVLERPVVKRG
jgi:hypothetical protein